MPAEAPDAAGPAEAGRRSSPDTTARPRPPGIISVDDDPPVLDAVVSDLRARYGDRHRIIGAVSGEEALTVAEQMARRGDELALVIADQRMPGMAGTALLAAVKELHPHARTVLLTAYADTDAAIAAINEIRLDQYIMKPWDPPEERLYPVIDELLEEWHATRPRPDAGLRAVGDRWSAASHRLRDYLARSQVPFRWVDIEHPDAGPLLAAVPEGTRPPLLVLEDGRVLSDPTPAQVADVLHLSERPEIDFHDLVIVGAGPAGLAAAVYGGSEGLRTVVVEAEAPGGQAGLSSRIENYLGFPSGVSGSELARRALAQARRFGTTVMLPHRAVRVRREDPYRVVVLGDGSEVHCSAVILATGVEYRRLEAPGVEELTGSGVYYGAAATEAVAMKGHRVVVVGGANSAGQAAAYLARFAREVVVVARSASLGDRMSRYLADELEATDNVRVMTGARLVAAEGDHRLEQVVVAGPDDRRHEIEAAGMFVFIGAQPGTEWLVPDIALDGGGFVLTGPGLKPDRWPLARDPFLLETSIPGVFAVGDLRSRSVKRIASAVGEGSVAVQFVHEILAGGS